MNKAVLMACLFAAGAASPVLAANATRPYQNCDRKNDNCGPTGNDMTDQFNARQLGANGGMQGGSAMPMGNSNMPMNGMPMNGASTMPMGSSTMPMNRTMPMNHGGGAPMNGNPGTSRY